MVTDDAFAQNETPKEIWTGDSVQLALLSSQDGKSTDERSEFSMALMDGKPCIYRNRVQGGGEPG